MVKEYKAINLSVIIPSYKEKNVWRLRQQIEFYCHHCMFIERFEVIIANDPKGSGYGATLKRGIAMAKYRWILIMDADFTYPPREISRLVLETRWADMVIAERRGTITASGLLRSFGRYLVKRYAVMRSGFPIADINSGMRIFKRSLYDNFKSKLPNKYSFTTTITLLSFAEGYKITYVPIFYEKRSGKSKLKPMEFFNFIRTINKCLKK